MFYVKIICGEIRNIRQMTRRPRPRYRSLILILIVCFVIYFLGFIICRQIISGTAITIYIFSSFTNHAVTRLASSPLGSNIARRVSQSVSHADGSSQAGDVIGTRQRDVY